MTQRRISKFLVVVRSKAVPHKTLLSDLIDIIRWKMEELGLTR